MPIRDTDESGEPQADSDLLEYIDRRRDYQARKRRRRFLVAAVAALGVIAIILAFSNVVLMRRLAARTESPPVASLPTPAPSAAPAPEVATSVASGPTALPAEPAPPSATRPPAANTGMVLESTTPPAPRRSTTPRSAGATDGDSARRTARWLVQTHGRVEAESRVTKVAEFYSGEQGAFWQRVLLNVRQAPER